jgi:hypothetical protein
MAPGSGSHPHRPRRHLFLRRRLGPQLARTTSALHGDARRTVADLLAAHRLPAPFIDAERAAMAEVRRAPTANRSVVGVLNEFTFLADIHRAGLRRADVDRAHARANPSGLLELSVQLATTPLGPLYQRHVSPDRELAALVADRT